MATLSLKAAAALVSTLVVLTSIEPSLAQEAPAAPRTPMSPGSSFKDSQMMAPADRDNALLDHYVGMAPARTSLPRSIAPTNVPDLAVLETAAITLVAEGKADIVVSSRAQTELVLQLYRPEQNQWEEFHLAPLTNTPISCASCGGRLQFSFSDGTQQSEIDLEAPAILRIYPDPAGTRWQWDSFKLQSAAKRD